MTTPVFDHDRLDVYRLSIDYVAASFVVAIHDILSATDGVNTERHSELKPSLKRIVSMLTRLIARADAVSEPESEYEYEYEYRDAEYEYDGCAEPELSRPPEPGLRPISNGKPTFPAR